MSVIVYSLIKNTSTNKTLSTINGIIVWFLITVEGEQRKVAWLDVIISDGVINGEYTA